MKIAIVAVLLLIAAALTIVFTQTVQRQVSLVIANGIVVTMNGRGQIIRDGAVAIDGRDIVAVDAADEIRRQFRGAETIDAAGAVVMPGLVNTHTHAPMVLYRGLADDLALMEWLQKYIFPAEAKTVSREFVRAGTRLAVLEMIQSGTTAYADMYYFEEEIARDPSSALAAGREIAEKNRTVPATAWPLRLSLSLLPAALMASADPRRRPGVATIVYGLGYVHRLRLVSHEPASLRAARASCERDRDGSATHGGVRRRRRPRVALALRPPGGRRARPARRAAPAPGDLRRLSESPGQVSDRR